MRYVLICCVWRWREGHAGGQFVAAAIRKRIPTAAVAHQSPICAGADISLAKLGGSALQMKRAVNQLSRACLFTWHDLQTVAPVTRAPIYERRLISFQVYVCLILLCFEDAGRQCIVFTLYFSILSCLDNCIIFILFFFIISL